MNFSKKHKKHFDEFGKSRVQGWMFWVHRNYVICHYEDGKFFKQKFILAGTGSRGYKTVGDCCDDWEFSKT